MNNKLGKNFKIKNKSYIQILFKYGYYLIDKDIKLIYYNLNFLNQQFHFKYIISISKKKIKYAVDRNKIKRLLRECIRLNKNKLIKKIKKNTIFILIYQSKYSSTFAKLEKQYLNILKQIKN